MIPFDYLDINNNISPVNSKEFATNSEPKTIDELFPLYLIFVHNAHSDELQFLLIHLRPVGLRRTRAFG